MDTASNWPNEQTSPAQHPPAYQPGPQTSPARVEPVLIEAAQLLDFEPEAAAQTSVVAEVVHAEIRLVAVPDPEPVLDGPIPEAQVLAEQVTDCSIAVSVEALLDQVKEAQQHLQNANYKIGYLEAEIDSLQQQLLALPDLEEQARRLTSMKSENEELRRILPALQGRANRLSSLEQQNEELRRRVEALQRRQLGRWWQAILEALRSWLIARLGGPRHSESTKSVYRQGLAYPQQTVLPPHDRSV